MTKYTREEILANRQKWIDFLLEPERKKATGFLDLGDGFRCCLGHGCHILGVKNHKFGNKTAYGDNVEGSVAPPEFIEMVGLYDEVGLIGGGDGYENLAEMNDEENTTPQEIGQFLLDRIEGGLETPFKSLSKYPKA